MSYQPLLMSGIILGKSSGSMSIGTPIAGADPNAILTTDSAGNLSDKVLTSGQILIGSTGAAPIPATLTGTASQILISSVAGSITLSLPQNIGTSSDVTFGSISLQPSGSVDTTAPGTLAIGTNNASIINIGNSAATVNIQGTVLYENVTQLQVKDPLITLNKGAGAGSASGAGVEIEEAGVITAFSKTSADRLSYTFKAPATAGIVTVTPGSSGITLNQSSHDPVTLGTPSGLSLSSQILSLAVATSTVTGALSSTDWSTFNSKQPAGNYLTALTGDGTASGPGSSLLTLSTVNATPGTFGSNSSVNTTTVNAKGLVTSIVNNPIQITESQVTNLVSDLAGKQPIGNYVTALTGDVAASGPGSAIATLATVNAAPGTTGSASNTSTITTNAKGLVIANTSTPIQITESQVTNLVSDLAGKQPVGNYVTALTGDGSASGPGSATFTLSTVNLSPGITGSASSTSTITTNGKGLVTANTSTPIQITESQVTGLVADLASKVTSVSVVSLNGLAGTSSGGSTPALTLSTTVTGVLKGNGTAISAAVAGTDYQAPGAYVTSLTGDATGTGPGATALTLATVNAAPGTTGSASSTSIIVTNAKGLVTSNTNTPIQVTEAQVTNLVSDLAGKQPTGNYLTALIGDITATGPGSATATLATVNATPGIFGSASSVNTITVNAKGLTTTVTNAPIQIAESQVTGLVSDLASKVTAVSVVSANGLTGTSSGGSTPALTLSTTITGLLKGNGTAISAAAAGTDYQAPGAYITSVTGDATATGPGAAALTLATVNSTPGTFGSVSSHPIITVNAKGLITASSSAVIQIAESQVTNLVSDLAGKQATGSYITALTGDVIANGPGSSGSVVFSVGGASATSVASAATAVATATDAITANTLIKRDASGNFQVNTQNSASSTTLPASTAFVQNAITVEANARIAANALLIPLAQKGAPNGVAPLDGSSKIPASYLPSYVDEVQPYANLAAFPATGATNVIYIANDTNKVYRWTGSSYIEISASPGSTDAVPEGSINLYYTQARFNTAFAAKTTTNLTEGTNLYFTAARASTAAPVQSVSGRTGAVVLTSADVGLSNVQNLDQTNPSNIVQDATHRFSTDVEKSYWNAKQPAGNYVTALTGDVTASGPGSSVATVVTVGGASATSVATSVSATLAATSLSTASTIAKRDASGASNFKLLNLDGTTSGTIGLSASPTQTAYTITLPSAAPTTGTALVYNGTSYVWSAPTTTGITALTGDVTATGPGSSTSTLATVNSAPGTFGSASSVNTVTVNAKGLVTSITNAPIQIAESQVTNLVSDLASKVSSITISTANGFAGLSTGGASPILVLTTSVTGLVKANGTAFSTAVAGTDYQAPGAYITSITGDATGTGPGAAALTLATVNATPGTFGSASTTNTVIVNAKGLVTSVTSSAIQVTEAQVTNLVSDLAGKQATGNYITSVTGDVTGSGPGAAALTLTTVNANIGTFNNLTVNAKGLVTSASNIVYQSPISLTTSGTSGAATFVSNTLNIPQYQAAGSYITSLTGDATATGPGAAAITLATVNSTPGTFNNVTVNAKGLVTAASNVAYAPGNAGDISPGSFSTLANNTANQSITGLSFPISVSSFEALLNIQISAAANTYTTVSIFGTRRAAATWVAADISSTVRSDMITGLSFGITTTGVVTISIGAITGFTSGIIKYRALTLS